MAKPVSVPILPCGGIDNVHSPDHQVFQFKRGPGGGLAPPDKVVEVNDMYLDSGGILFSRPGVQVVRALTRGLRLFSKGGMLLSQDGGALCLEDPTTGNATTLADGLDHGSLMVHEWPSGGDRAFVTDGAINLCIRAGTVVPWGLSVPDDPQVSAIPGSLPEASYLITATYRSGPLTSATAQEGGAPTPLSYALTSPGGLRIVVEIYDPNATHVAFYCSRPDQPEPVLVSVVPVHGITATLDIVASTQLYATESPVITQNDGPPPAGITALGSLQAFMLAAVGSAVFRSWAGIPGLFSYNSEVQVFPAPVTAIVGLQDGAWIGTEQGLYWLSGDNPTVWRRTLVDPSPILPEGSRLPGSAFPTLQTEETVAMFASRRGLIAGLPGGQIRHLTQDVYHFPTAERVSITCHDKPLRQLLVAVTEPE